jgi:hypothetical protein
MALNQCSNDLCTDALTAIRRTNLKKANLQGNRCHLRIDPVRLSQKHFPIDQFDAPHFVAIADRRQHDPRVISADRPTGPPNGAITVRGLDGAQGLPPPHLTTNSTRATLMSLEPGLVESLSHLLDLLVKSLRASVNAVSRSARSLVDGLSVVLATARDLLPAVDAQGAALLMSGDRIGSHRQVERLLLRRGPPRTTAPLRLEPSFSPASDMSYGVAVRCSRLTW